ncbi:lysine--tRNA ligase [Candidatus Kaiserbacteria bacterium RIFCSPHIGHO2_01_FULL_48_10]|uniref:Lysine--tRNA ligase n=1 Tax=Candidatus Kaiserbacteria bacterium RIFCSPHIGHO2_01_FULL_48_10 TaxID=1798476 RepID=A0A1F6C6L9_9BACT|nr:MAG: lysine--tRNA ligase [Candidatus Kaiserbacteria bacterium RIFCSPHIGHO2_01_FULL_48_10]
MHKEHKEHQSEYEERKAKREELTRAGIQPYPSESHRSHSVSECLSAFDEWMKKGESVLLAGRVRSIREHGGLTFLSLEDASGVIQFVFKKDHLGADVYDSFLRLVDVGDFIEISGTLFLTKRGEKSVDVSKWRILTKALRPLPEKWHGLQDVEERLRRRYLDLIMNSAERELFEKKSRFWYAMRSYLIHESFLEVETPVLEHTPGGADAEPFATHMNALDMDLYLRISLELPLKRLIVGGFEKVFEIGRIFRNEGVDREHLQDYTQLELYWAYVDYKKMMTFVRLMYQDVIQKTLGSLTHEWNGQTIDWGGIWKTVEYVDVFKEKTGLDPLAAKEADLISLAKKHKLDPDKHIGRARLLDLLFKKLARPSMIQPVFLVNPPVEIEPLAKRMSGDPMRVERFQVMACGSEIGKGFSELNDPIDQRARFEEQMKLRKAGDREAQMMDEDFVEALEYGMPPTAGFGTSERLFSVIMNRPIRETVFFPLMRPVQK